MNVIKSWNHLVCYWIRVVFADRPCCLEMRRDVQEIFKMTPHEKQVLMFSATLSKDIRPVCKKFMQDVSLTRCYSTRMICFFSADGNLHR